MTLKSSFWVNCRENLKRRSWTILLCASALFLALPIRLALEISVENRRITEDPRWLGDLTTPREWLQECFMRASSNMFMTVLIFGLAVLFAVQGFSWLDSRRKLDLYLSVPVSGRKRFAVIYLNGVWMFAACYLAMLLLALMTGALMGAVSCETVVYAFLMYLCSLLFYIACYNLALIAVMLTGNVLVSLLAAAVLFLYEYMIRVLFDGMSSYFVTYCDLGNVADASFTSPLMVYLYGSDGLLQYLSGYGSRYLAAFGRTMLLLAVQAAVYGLLACLLYKKRRAEAAGNAIAFPGTKTPVKLLMMIPLTLLCGLWFRDLASYSLVFTLIGMALGLLLSHCLIQIVYEFDVRSILSCKWHLLAAGAVSAVVFAFFSLDLAGYDSYIPKTEEVESVGVAFASDIYSLGFYENMFGRDMYRQQPEEYMLKHMRSEEEAVIEAVRSLAADNRQERTAAGADGRSYYGAQTDTVQVLIRYTLKNGKEVYRAILADVEDCAEEMDVIFADPSFQTVRYQICDPSFVQKSEEIQVSYGNGLNEMAYLSDVEELLRAYGSDLEKYSYSLMLNALPVGELRFSWTAPGGKEEAEYVWAYPVYQEFTKTIALLQEQDVYMALTEAGGFLSSDQIVSVSVTCYNLQEGDVEYSAGGSRSVTYSADQEITRTYTEPGEIGQILPALYPEGLTEVAGAGITGRLWNDNYTVSVVFQPDEYFSERNLMFTVVEEGLPQFVREETRYSE